MTTDAKAVATAYRGRVYAAYASKIQGAAESFDFEESARWGAAYRHYLRDLLPADANAAICDVACGRGRLLDFYRRAGYRNIVGVDTSAEQVALARQVIDDVHLGDAIAFLNARPASFDVISGIDVIEHLTKNEVLAFLDAAMAALRPGGRLILQTPNAESPWGSMLRYADFTHELSFTPESLSRILSLVGFERIDCRELGPILWGYSLRSTLRALVWRMIRLSFVIWNLAELGHRGGGVFTRVMIASATKAPA